MGLTASAAAGDKTADSVTQGPARRQDGGLSHSGARTATRRQTKLLRGPHGNKTADSVTPRGDKTADSVTQGPARRQDGGLSHSGARTATRRRTQSLRGPHGNKTADSGTISAYTVTAALRQPARATPCYPSPSDLRLSRRCRG